MKIMTSEEFCKRLKDIANNYETLYVMGGIGYRLNNSGKARSQKNSWNTKASRKKMIYSATEHTWAFDCVCLIKSVLWGWKGDEKMLYGGATYCSNGVLDISTDGLILKCDNVSSDFATIEAGEVVWISGHVGIYVGNGEVVECSPKWSNNVQISHLGNIDKYKTGHYRIWKKRGKLPFIDYGTISNVTEKPTSISNSKKKSNEEIANEVVKGVWGNGTERKNRLTKAGYDYSIIQKLVNSILSKKGK